MIDASNIAELFDQSDSSCIVAWAWASRRLATLNSSLLFVFDLGLDLEALALEDGFPLLNKGFLG